MKIKNKNFLRELRISICKEFLSISVLSIFCSQMMLSYGGLVLSPDSYFRYYGVLVFALTPVFLIYIAARLFLLRMASVFLCLIISVVLIYIQYNKFALTGVPLVYGDLTNISNLKVARHFIGLRSALLVSVLLVCLAVVLWRSFIWTPKNKHDRDFRGVLIKGVFILAIAPFPFYMYLPSSPVNIQSVVYGILHKNLSINYASWKWSENVKSNGLFVHLIQTAKRSIPEAPSADETVSRITPWLDQSSAVTAPKHVFMILCEACWYDDSNFRIDFAPLLNMGFTEMRAISPVYGGGTANSEFEMLTALPSHGPLYGLIYQEYVDYFSKNAITIPSRLREMGYKTLAIHNFYGDFFNRRNVLGSFGFDRFISIEDMKYEGGEQFPGDELLFDRALSELKDDFNKNTFYHLITVSNHGPYDFGNDYGESGYRKSVSKTVADIYNFVKGVLSVSDDSLFVVYGDHKPLLTKYFFEKGVIPASFFSSTGSGNSDFKFEKIDMSLIGDVPLLVLGKNKKSVSDLKAVANNLPLYCVIANMDEIFLGTRDPAAAYVRNNACGFRAASDLAESNYDVISEAVPGWLYGALLFDDKNTRDISAVLRRFGKID